MLQLYCTSTQEIMVFKLTLFFLLSLSGKMQVYHDATKATQPPEEQQTKPRYTTERFLTFIHFITHPGLSAQGQSGYFSSQAFDETNNHLFQSVQPSTPAE